MTEWPTRVSASPNSCTPEALTDVHGLKIQPDFSLWGGSCLLGLDRKTPGDSPSLFTSEKPFKMFLTAMQLRQEIY